MDEPRHSTSRDDQASPPQPTPQEAREIDTPSVETANTEIKHPESEHQYPKGLKLATVFIGLFLAILCVSLDRSILATAVPKITSEFYSLDDVGWYGSAYLLTSCCFQLMFGKLYAEFNVKWVFLSALAIFEIGSIVCAAAPNSVALIIGRAVAGLGSAGLTSGALIILAYSVPLHNRPKFTGAIGGALGVSQVVAPLLGGVFADYVTWRWCFWINLPLGGVTMIVIFFFLYVPVSHNRTPAIFELRKLLVKLDILGTVFLLPSMVCLLLALQWGGSTYSWGSWRVILLLCIFGVTIIVWAYIQYRRGDTATVPPRIFLQRSMLAASCQTVCTAGCMFLLIYFVPIYFQAVKNTTAAQAGINYLTTSIAMSLTTIASGFFTSKIGYYNPGMISSIIVTSLATGLITRFNITTTTGYWMGSLIVFGIGLGLGVQQPIMVPQILLSGPDVALGTSIIIFMQTLSGAVFLSVGDNVFDERILAELAVYAPTADPATVVKAGAAQLASAMGKIYPEAVVRGIVAAYSAALQRVFMVPVVLICLGIFGAVACEWHSVRRDIDKKKEAPAGQGEKDVGAGPAESAVVVPE